jgi:hypothetical protein
MTTSKKSKKSPKKSSRSTVKAFTIDRSKWACGENANRLTEMGRRDEGNETALLTDHGRMCCLGFYAKACGVPNKSLKGIGEPCDLTPRQGMKLSEKILRIEENNYRYSKDDPTHHLVNKSVTSDLIQVNDDMDVRLDKREKKIASLFKKVGINVKFTGKYIGDQK